jgi:hypothetical protein
MARRSNKHETLLALFAKSGNVCAFPGCNEEVVTNRQILVGQICHIEAANPGGPRYNPNSNDEERRAFENLMLMCYKHHRETDDVASFDTQRLKAIKAAHEKLHGQKPFKVNEAFLFRLEDEMDHYWAAIADSNSNQHVIPNLAVPIPVGTTASQQFSSLLKSLERLQGFVNELSKDDRTLNDEIRNHMTSLGYDTRSYDAVPYYQNPFYNRNLLIHRLGIRNTLTDLFVALKQAEVRFLEEYMKTHPNDALALEKLNATKTELRHLAVSAGYAD